MMSKKKKAFVLVGMFVLLVATAVLNYVLSNPGASADDGSQDVLASANFFTAYRALRTSTRNEEILYLDSIIGTTGDEFAEQRAQAAEDKMKLVKNMELELTLESLIKGKGYQDVYVAVGSGSDNLHIFVNTAELTTQDAAIIYTIAMEEAGKTPDEVKIIPLA